MSSFPGLTGPIEDERFAFAELNVIRYCSSSTVRPSQDRYYVDDTIVALRYLNWKKFKNIHRQRVLKVLYMIEHPKFTKESLENPKMTKDPIPKYWREEWQACDNDDDKKKAAWMEMKGLYERAAALEDQIHGMWFSYWDTGLLLAIFLLRVDHSTSQPFLHQINTFMRRKHPRAFLQDKEWDVETMTRYCVYLQQQNAHAITRLLAMGEEDVWYQILKGEWEETFKGETLRLGGRYPERIRRDFME